MRCLGMCCRRHQIDPPAGILLTQSKPSRTVAYTGGAPIWGGSVKIGSLGQKRVGANSGCEKRSGTADLNGHQLACAL